METIETLGQRLEHALRKYADKIVEAACCNNAQRLRELHDGLRALREVLVEWRLVAQELSVFSTASANGCDFLEVNDGNHSWYANRD
jgi:hypothetical protein